MKNIRQDLGDSMRSEYERSDFGEMVPGKYATAHLQSAEMVRLLLVCIGEDEGLKLIHHLEGNSRAGRRPGDWTYEFGSANQITLRYWVTEFGSIEEPISNPPCVNNAQERAELQSLLLNHIRALKTRVDAL